jgi:septal ring factor EnvC (AmiA/AmiB activator)
MVGPEIRNKPQRDWVDGSDTAAGTGTGAGTGGGPGPLLGDPPTSTPRLARVSGRSKVGIGLTAVVLIVTFLGISSLQARSQFRQTSARLAHTRATLRQTVSELQRARVSLAKTTAQGHATQETLARVNSQLSAARAQLSTDQRSLYIQGVSISAVDSCLAGVESALNEIALNDSSGAAASLNQVASSCQTAQVGNG